MELECIPIEKPDDVNVILGPSHFIKTVDDVFEALAGSAPRLRFGLAFCESWGRVSSVAPEMTTSSSPWPPRTRSQ